MNEKLSKKSDSIINRMKNIIEDIYYGRVNSSPTKYLKSKKERTWFFKFLKEYELLSEDNVWIGPDISEMKKNTFQYTGFLISLYNERVKFLNHTQYVEKENKQDEIPGIQNVEISRYNVPLQVIEIKENGMFYLKLGKNGYSFLVSVNNESCSIHVMESNNQEPNNND